LLNRYLAKAPLSQKLAGGFLKIRESGKGLSHFKFLQDTGVIWLPKMLVSRSGVERFEISFLEFVESAYLYYAAPLSAEKLFMPLMAKLSPKKLTVAQIAKPMSEIPKALHAQVLPVKAATILAGLLTMTIAGNFALHFIKNLLTEKAFKKNKFSDIVNLSHGKVHDTSKDTHVSEKAKRRIVQSVGLSAGILAGAMALARYGGRVKALQKPMQAFVKHMDFAYKNGSVGTTFNHLRFIVFPINIAGYIDAARDHLERIEVLCRSTIVGFYVCGGGAEMLESGLVKMFSRQRGSGQALKSVLKGKGAVKTFDEIEADVLKRAQSLLSRGGKTPTGAQVEKKALSLLAPRLAAKYKMFYTPLAFGAALFNRYWTQYRFQKEQQERRDQLTQHFQREHI
jgi:hypothetical protein